MDLHNEVEHDTDPVASRAGEATRKGAQAFARLLQLAEQRSSGQIVRVVGFRHTDGDAGSPQRSPSHSEPTAGRDWLHRSSSLRRQATARAPRRTGLGNCCWAMSL